MNKKLCIFVTVSSERYAYYIPFFYHFIELAYPEYHVMVNYQGRLPEAVTESLRLFNNGNFMIQENAYENLPKTPDTIKILRWLACFSKFDYDYIYVGDVDVWIMNEQPSLLDKHIRLCAQQNTCYSNTDKIDPPAIRGNRMTGLHFFEHKIYVKTMGPIIKKYMQLLHEKGVKNIPEFYNNVMKRVDNQHALWSMIKESGLKMPQHSFFEYHGLHLGHSRCEGRWEDLFTNCPLHRKYFLEFDRHIHNKRFWKIYSSTIPVVKEEINKMIIAGAQYV